jgi:hypothetical protein
MLLLCEGGTGKSLFDCLFHSLLLSQLWYESNWLKRTMNSDEPFAGVDVILSGDPLQLSPSAKSVRDKRQGQSHDNNGYCEYLDFTSIVELTKNISFGHHISSRKPIAYVMGPELKRTSHSPVKVRQKAESKAFASIRIYVISNSKRCAGFSTNSSAD